MPLLIRARCLAITVLMITLAVVWVLRDISRQRKDQQRTQSTHIALLRDRHPNDLPPQASDAKTPFAKTKPTPNMVETYGNLPMRFEANAGQIDKRARFFARGGGYSLFLTSTEAVLALRGNPVNARGDSVKTGPKAPEPTRAGTTEQIARQQRTLNIVRMTFVGANRSPKISGLDALPGKSNYFAGNKPAEWRTDISTYARVKYENVYSGIDAIYYGTQGQLEFDFVVAPHADYKQIKLKYRGAKEHRIDKATGDLIFTVGDGGELRQHKPVVYQEIAGVRRMLEGGYEPNHGDISFRISEYDRNYPLVIDPTLGYSTFLGGDNFDHGFSVAVDSEGSAYVSGVTGSTNFPNQSAVQASNGGGDDAFVAKLSSDGTQLVFASYLGGNGEDVGTSVAVDSQGNSYLTGTTRSSNFPTQNALQSSFGGGFADAFVTKLNSSGNQIIYSTYLGGGGGASNEAGNGIAVDAQGNAFVGGYTQSFSFPVVNALQPLHGNGLEKGFLSKFNSSGTQLLFSTYLGGAATCLANAIAIDGQGNAYLTGYTTNDLDTQNPIQGTHGGDLDAFAMKVNAAGNQLNYSTYLGGSNRDIGVAIAVDALGSAHITGVTSSNNFPTSNPLQATIRGFRNAFVTKINGSGSQFVYSTYLGGTGNDDGNGIAVDGQGNVYITGQTTSPDFPVMNPIQPTIAGGFSDAFITKLNDIGAQLVYSSYLGGSSSGVELGRGVAVDGQSNAYVTGTAASADFPIRNPFQATIRGAQDAFVLKIVEQVIPLLKQDDPAWNTAADIYDHLDDYSYQCQTMACWGCGTTSLTMIILSYGVSVGADGLPVTPKNLNNWLKSKSNGYLGEGNVNWSMVDEYTGHRVHYLGPGEGGFPAIEADLNTDRRVIARVKNNSHFVVVTQKSGTTFLINDPLFPKSTLAEHGNVVNYTRRFERGSGTPIKKMSVIAKSPVELIITDPMGRRTGFDPQSDTPYNEIPGASYTREILASVTLPEDSRPPVFNEPVKTFYLQQPVNGLYQVTVIGTANGQYAIDVNQTDVQGTEVFQTLLGSISLSMSVNYVISYDTQGGTLPPNPFLRTITGRVRDESGNGVSGVTITLGGSQSAATLTDPSGNYSLGSVQQVGNYTVAPSKVGFSFNPPALSFSNVSTNVSADFVGTHAPIVLTENGTNNVAALNSVTFQRSPFRLLDPSNFSTDRRTRVIFFTSDLGLTQQNASLLSVQASGFNLPVETVGPLLGVPGLNASYIVVRLPDGLPPGDLQLTITLNGVTSNVTRLTILP